MWGCITDTAPYLFIQFNPTFFKSTHKVFGPITQLMPVPLLHKIFTHKIIISMFKHCIFVLRFATKLVTGSF